MKRLILFANKSWETEPIIAALISPRFSPDKKIMDPSILHNPWLLPQGTPKPRAMWDSYNGVQIELWCFQDIMEISDPSDSELYSTSEIKKNNIYKAFDFSSQPPDLILALGTAAFSDETINNNGCVVTGSNIFIHNFHPNGKNPKSKWDDPRFEQLIPSSVPNSFFSLADTAAVTYIESRLLRPFNNPSPEIQIISDRNFAALSVVNITNYADYATSDPEGINAMRKAGINNTAGSVETTHGIIRLGSETPFAFISGITDRLNHFNDDVGGKDSKGNTKTEAQNFVAAFNIGVYLASMLPKIAGWLQTV